MNRIKRFWFCDSIYDSYRLLHIFSKTFGFTAYNFDFNKKEAYFDSLSIAELITIIFTWMFFNYKSIQNFKSIASFSKLNFIYMIFLLLQAINPFLFINITIFHNLKRKSVAKFLQKIHSFDESLKYLQWKFQVKNNYFFMLFVILIFMLLLGVKLIYFSKTVVEIKMTSVVAVIGDVPIFVITIANLILSSMSVHERFKILRKNFIWWQFGDSRELWVVKTIEKERKMLLNLTKLAVKLLDALDEINSTFTVQGEKIL